MPETFVPHSDKQEQLIFSDNELTIGAFGTQWGKSQGGAIWMKRQIHEGSDGKSAFLLMAPTYKIMQQSMLPYFLHYMEGAGDHKKAEAVYELYTGDLVFLRTGTDPNSIVGIPRVKAYWLDEAGLASLYFWENVLARAAAIGAKGLLTTSPYTLNWLYKDYIKPKLAGGLPKVRLLQGASWENPYHSLHDPKRRAEMEAQMDPRRFKMLFGGEWSSMVGLVYDCWDDDQNLVEPFELPPGTRYYAGVDWGFTDPFALKVRAVTPDGRHYGVSEFYKSGLTLMDQIEIARQKHRVYGIQTFWCDPSQPGSIEEMGRAGLPAAPADNDIRRGIDLHYELIKTRRYKEFKGACPYSADERQMYHYPEPKDLKPDQDSKDQLPVGQNDHAMDCDRYLTLMTYRAQSKKAPRAPEAAPVEEDIHARMERLRRPSRRNQSESWS